MRNCANGVKCGVVEWAKRNTLKWSGHSEEMKSEELIQRANVIKIEGLSWRGRPLGRWKDRVKEYMCERGAGRGF